MDEQQAFDIALLRTKSIHFCRKERRVCGYMQGGVCVWDEVAKAADENINTREDNCNTR
jgi:hypothetical protein